MKVSEHIKIFLRAVKMFFQDSKAYMLGILAVNILTVAKTYVPIYFSARLIDALYAKTSIQTLIWYVVFIIGWVFVLEVLKTYASSQKEIAAGAISRSENWRHSQKAMEMAYESIENQDVSKLCERIKSESQAGYNQVLLCFFLEKLIYHVTNIIVALSLTASFFAMEKIPLYMKFLFAFGVIFNILYGMWATKKSTKYELVCSEGNIQANMLSAKYKNYMDDYSSGKDIRMYEMADSLQEFHRRYNEECVKRISKLHIQKFLLELGESTWNYVLKVGTYLILIYGALLGSVSVGTIAQYVSSIMLMLGSVSGLVQAVQVLMENNQYLKRYFEYFDIENKMYQGMLTVEKRDDNEYYVEFRDVSFRYPNTEAYALRHVNLKFKVGEKLAIVGMNGSGKTTFIKLLCRLYDPTEGEILLNGVNIKKYDYDEYMSIFSVVFQDFSLLSFKLGENVAANASYDKVRVEECLSQAGLGERLKQMPEGADTYLYKDMDRAGVEISGGEAQKIALARALYKDAPFIVLDEPTAALDPISEYEVYHKFNESAGDKTAIYISHRLASCRFCDKIAVFHKGEIVQAGNHKNLLAETSGKYYELWHAQAQYYV